VIQSELEKRYSRAIALLKRMDKAEAKLHWEEGETYEDVMLDIRHLLSDLRLEKEMEELYEAESRTVV
jgi:hypothetical protein